jgi:hypothetical protein
MLASGPLAASRVCRRTRVSTTARLIARLDCRLLRALGISSVITVPSSHSIT